MSALRSVRFWLSLAIAVMGHPAGGAIWLGAPVAIALAVHALTCVVAFFIATQMILTRNNLSGSIIPRLQTVPCKLSSSG